MKKLSIRKKFLAFLITGNVLLTGCSYSGDMESTKKDNSNNSSFSQSTIDENSNNIESSYDYSYNIDNSSKDESSKLESNEESNEESNAEICSSQDEISNFDSVSSEEIFENSFENSIEDFVENSNNEISDNSNAEIVLEISNSYDELSENESSIEVEVSSETLEESEEFEDYEKSEESEEIEESKNDMNESSEESFIDDFSQNEDSELDNEIFTHDNNYIRAMDYVNVQTKPSIESEVITTLFKGDFLKKIGIIDDWYIVEYNGKKAYVMKEYTDEIKEKKLKIDLSKSNICYFSQGSTLYSDKELKNKICDIPTLESGIIFYQSDNAFYIEVNGIKGYVHTSNLAIVDLPIIVVDESDHTATLYNQYNSYVYDVKLNNENTPTSKGLFMIKSKSYNKKIDIIGSKEENINLFIEYGDSGEGIYSTDFDDNEEKLKKEGGVLINNEDAKKLVKKINKFNSILIKD